MHHRAMVCGLRLGVTLGSIVVAACAEGNAIEGGGGATPTTSATTSATGQTTSSSTGAHTPTCTAQKPLACGASCVDPMGDVSHCGGCDRACTDPPNGDAACVGGECVVGDCVDGRADCNHDFADGCERALACGPGTPLPDCDAACAGQCVPAAETCNLMDDDCNDACDDGVACRVAVHRSSGASGHFYTTDANEAACCGMTVEATSYFHLYASAAPGLVAFHRCLLPSGYHFYTVDAACAGGTLEGTMGFIATSATCDGSPLFYLSLAAGDHFYTTSADERDYAVTLGYVDQGIAGYVWLTP